MARFRRRKLNKCWAANGKSSLRCSITGSDEINCTIDLMAFWLAGKLAGFSRADQLAADLITAEELEKGHFCSQVGQKPATLLQTATLCRRPFRLMVLTKWAWHRSTKSTKCEFRMAIELACNVHIRFACLKDAPASLGWL